MKILDMENGHGEVEVKIFVIGSVLWESLYFFIFYCPGVPLWNHLDVYVTNFE